MDTIIGIVGKDYVLVASDAMAGRSIIVFKSDEDKTVPLNKNTIIGMSGPQGDRAHFGDYIKRNIYLQELRSEIPMTTSAIAHFTRSELHDALRSNPFQVNILLGGVDDNGPELYYMDYLASMQKVDFGVHGHASNFLLSILDKYWVEGLSLEEGMDILSKCLRELNTRFLISFPSWKLKIITKNGVEDISLETLAITDGDSKGFVSSITTDGNRV